MSLSTWWRGDPLPRLPELPSFEARLAADQAELAGVNRLALAEVQRRWADGHRAYLGYLAGRPVTYGWVAPRRAAIGELALDFALPPGDRYLWDFATLPAWQGRGLYPRLLQAIVADAPTEVQRLWIIHAPENLPSGAGMGKAGFEPVGQLSFRAAGGVGLAPLGAGALLGVPIIDTVLAPCWTCGGAAAAQSAETALESCWPPVRPTERQCTCASPVRPSLDG